MASHITLIITFHREGYLARSALLSAINACCRAETHGYSCDLIAVLDSGDEQTRKYILPFRDKLDGFYEGEFDDISLARNYVLKRIQTPFFALLDGDDLLSPDWLWKGLRHIENHGNDNTVVHTQYRVTFGDEYHCRMQLATDEPLFHPLYLIASWAYATDLIAPVELYKRLPYTKRDGRCGFAAEDWYWVCESLVDEVTHLIVPDTAYYYRRVKNRISLGLLPGITFPRSRLFDKIEVERLLNERSTSACILTGQSSGLLSAPQFKLKAMPEWLKFEVEQLCTIEPDFYSLYTKLDTLKPESPVYYPTVATLYAELIKTLGDTEDAVFLFCNRLNHEVLALIDTLSHHLARYSKQKDKIQPLVCFLLGDTGPQGDKTEFPSAELILSQLFIFDLGNRPDFNLLYDNLKVDMLVRLLVQTEPSVIINDGIELIDITFGRFGRALHKRQDAQTIRLCRGKDVPRFDHQTLTNFYGIDLARGRYTHLLCERHRPANWFANYFNGLGITVRQINGESGNRGVSFGQALGYLITGIACQEEHIAKTMDSTPATWLKQAMPVLRDNEPIDVSCVVTASQEGYYLNQTILCILSMCRELYQTQRTVEMIIVLDRVGLLTDKVLFSLKQQCPHLKLIEVDCEDEARAKNIGIAASSGTYIAIFNGSDLLSSSWLVKALGFSEKATDPRLLHPRFVLDGRDGTLNIQPSCDDSHWHPGRLVSEHSWHTCVFGPRSLFIACPYQSPSHPTGFGHTTWHWNSETIAIGYRHLTVSDTVLFLRPHCRSGENITRPTMVEACAAVPPSKLFESFYEPDVFQNFLEPEYQSKRLTKEIEDIQLAKRFVANEAMKIARWEPSFSKAVITAICDQVSKDHFIIKSQYLSSIDAVKVFSEQLRSKVLHLFGIKTPEPIRSNQFPWEENKGIDRHLNASFSFAYRYACLKKIEVEMNPTHVFLTPTLQPGGAQLSMKNCIGGILTKPGNGVLVIVTETEKCSGYSEEFPNRYSEVWLSDLCADISTDEKIEFLARFLMNCSNTRRLHLMYSWTGWQCFSRYANALAQCMRIFVSIFSVPPVAVSGDSGFLPMLRPQLHHVSGIFTDNERTKRTLDNILGNDDSRLHILRHPVTAIKRFFPPSLDTIDILWAGRLDSDKKPQILLEIARQLPNLIFHVFGTNVLGTSNFQETFMKEPNIVFHGSFSGFDSIALKPYGLYIHTAVWEGMPNIVLEAMQSGLLVVAPDIGGIGEVLLPDRGVLLSQNPDSREYVAAIEEILREPDLYTNLALNGTTYVSANFTQKKLIASLEAVPNYL